MRVVVTHDVDHLSVYEHWHDLVIPKFIGVSLIELRKGLIEFREFSERLKELLNNGWNNIRDLARYDAKHGVKSTFYFAVKTGLGISYSANSAQFWIKWLLRKGFEVGLHGIEYKDIKGMRREKEVFSELSGVENFGIRMHYLRLSNKTLMNLEELGYTYDSTVYSNDLKQPYRLNTLVEIPLHLMDTYLFSPFYNAFTLEQAVDYTNNMLQKVVEKDLTLVILFHQRHFSKSFDKWKEWYEWFIERCEELGAEFVSPMEVAEWILKK